MNLPQIPDADAPGQPDADLSAQASAYRRALDAQAEDDGDTMLVPRVPHDLPARPDAQSIRDEFTANPPPSGSPYAAPAPRPTPAPDVDLDLAAMDAPAFDLPARYPAAADPTATSVFPAFAPISAAAQIPAPRPFEFADDPARSGAGPKSARMRTAVLVCTVLGGIAAGVLVFNAAGSSAMPMAPSALPSSAADGANVAEPAGGESAGPMAPRPPSGYPTAGQSGTAEAGTDYVTLSFGITGYPDEVAAVQRRLTLLSSPKHSSVTGYLVWDGTTGMYADAGWICGENCQSASAMDPKGVYGSATVLAVHAFEADHGLPVGPCTMQTYQVLTDFTGG